MIRPSPEIAAVVARWNRAVQARDTATLLNLLSASDCLLYQGSAEGENWSGEVLRNGFADHVKEIPDYDWDEHSVQAFENGETGWALCTATLTFASTGTSWPHRFTFILAIEDGVWKMVHFHVSNPVPNVEKIGIEHQALDALVAAARDGFNPEQSEGMASVMFTDIANSTRLAEAHGDRNWAARLGGHLDIVARAIEDHGGRLVKSLGDGSMSTFPSARAALAAAVAIQRRNAADGTEPPLALRIGVHSGDVIQTRDDFFGTVVNKAARIAAIARPDEIRASDATCLMTGSAQGFTFADPVTVQLRGLDGQHVIYRLDWRE